MIGHAFNCHEHCASIDGLDDEAGGLETCSTASRLESLAAEIGHRQEVPNYKNSPRS